MVGGGGGGAAYIHKFAQDWIFLHTVRNKKVCCNLLLQLSAFTLWKPKSFKSYHNFSLILSVINNYFVCIKHCFSINIVVIICHRSQCGTTLVVLLTFGHVVLYMCMFI